MMELFYTETDYKLTSMVTFPTQDIIGFNILFTENTNLPISLHKLTNTRYIDKNVYTLTISDSNKTNAVYCHIPSDLPSDKDHYTLQLVDSNNLYAGCLVVTDKFIAWLYSISFNDITCATNSVVFNPSYCTFYKDTNDFRFTYNNQKIDIIHMENLYYDEHTHKLEELIDEVKPIEKLYAEKIRISDDKTTVTLSGTNINIIPTETNGGIVKFDGQIIMFTDELKEGDNV